MPPETAKLLVDMKHAAERIERFVVGRTFDDYSNDELLRSGVASQFEVFGEAMTRLIERGHQVAVSVTDHLQWDQEYRNTPECKDCPSFGMRQSFFSSASAGCSSS